jgi:putative heme-binding domain-containing protein
MTAFFCAILLPLGQAAIAQTPQHSRTASAAERQSAEEGRQLFESTCAGCHALDGRGGERGPDISTRQQAVQLSDAELLEILRKGRPAAGMPPFDSLGSAKLRALLVYLRSLQGKGTATALPGDPLKGKPLFFGKARCSECHILQGAGGFLGRDLSAYGATLSPNEIRNNILRPVDSTNNANKTAVVTMRDARKFTGIIRNEDNFSIQLQSLDGAFHFLSRSDIAQLEFLPEPIMPADYATTLKPAELDDLVSFLISVTTPEKSAKKANWDEDE